LGVVVLEVLTALVILGIGYAAGRSIRTLIKPGELGDTLRLTREELDELVNSRVETEVLKRDTQLMLGARATCPNDCQLSTLTGTRLEEGRA
jgi:hypothetical protein